MQIAVIIESAHHILDWQQLKWVDGWADLMHARICTVTIYHSILCDDFSFNCSFFCLRMNLEAHFWASDIVFSPSSRRHCRFTQFYHGCGDGIKASSRKHLIDSDFSDDDDDMPNWSIWMWQWSCYHAVRLKYGWDIEFWSTQSSKVQFNSAALLSHTTTFAFEFTKKQQQHHILTLTNSHNQMAWNGEQKKEKATTTRQAQIRPNLINADNDNIFIYLSIFVLFQWGGIASLYLYRSILFHIHSFLYIRKKQSLARVCCWLDQRSLVQLIRILSVYPKMYTACESVCVWVF